MNDNDIYDILFPAMSGFFTDQGIDVEVVRAYHPTSEGLPEVPVVQLHKISDRRYGWPYRKTDVSDYTTERTTEQIIETTFQVSGYSRLSVNSTYTTSDLMKLLSGFMQSDGFIATLEAADIEIIRITDLRTNYVKDEMDRWEESTSFDFVIFHDQITIEEINEVESVELSINRV